MDKSPIEARLNSIQERFNSAQAQRNDFQVELHRLEGEYRLVQELIKEIGNAPSQQPREPTNSDKRTGK